ncbi:hypothetical protein CDAR_166251 [Caerostris darwini]|uniref:Uncharacterized protein n=1 Tax=Caerostris darwini TaxID=1538125 RepID=A0AAV4NUA6_9ARAC|nr:hypothetical protein CDAR_166251 [Caerostris darwini]
MAYVAMLMLKISSDSIEFSRFTIESVGKDSFVHLRAGHFNIARNETADKLAEEPGQLMCDMINLIMLDDANAVAIHREKPVMKELQIFEINAYRETKELLL